MDDIRYVFRVLGRSRAFSVAVILALGLGIGANAAMFGIIDRLLLRGPEHVTAPDELHRLYYTSADVHGKPGTFSPFGYVTYALLRDNARAIEGVAAYASAARVVGTGAESERVEGYMVTHGFFALLGARPALGRFFTEEEDLPPTGQNVVVLDYGFWQRRFAGDTSVVGSTVLLTGQPFRVVGVAPRGFTGAELRRADVWLPMALSRTRPDWPTTWHAQWIRIVARVKPGAATQAGAEAEGLFRQNYVGGNQALAGASLSFRPIAFTDAGREPAEFAVARWLTGVSVVVLLIACANVANLMLGRATRRRREVAVRLALGVGRLRLARMLTLEGLVLAIAGCALGLVLAHWGGQLIRSVFLPDVAWMSPPVNGRVIMFSIALALIAGTLVGLAPVLHTRRLDLNSALKSGSQQSGASRSTAPPLLVFTQAAFSFLLLVGAGLFIRSVHNVTSLDLGFEPDRALRASLGWASIARTPQESEAEAVRRRNVFATITQRLRSTPGVENAAVAVGTPFGNAFGVNVWVPGKDSIPDLGGGGPYVNAVEHGYFEATGMRLRAGRGFTPADNAGSERVVIVNEPMARSLWPGEGPLSKCLQIFSKELPCARVVGVVAEARRNALTEPPAMQYYVPFGQERSIGGSAIIVRPHGEPRQFVPTLRRIILDVDPSLLSTQILPMQESIDPLTRSWRLGATLFTVFGALALVIAAIGLYSVVAYLVTQRTQEFGVRMALGARTGDIVQLVLRNGLVTVTAGLGAGIAIALLAGRYVEPLLFETSSRDVVAFALAALTLGGSALLACCLPALRASQVDPAAALRTE